MSTNASEPNLSEHAMTAEKPTLMTAIKRGLNRRCPACGEGRAFKGYLKVVDACDHCHTPLGLYPCDDGPAYVTMIIVGHIVIAPLFMFDSVFMHYPFEILIPSSIAVMGALTLWLLPYIKGGFLGLVWRHGLKQKS
ncbi:DUF983 domain-containing protein [Asticcacaulis machinosus]|uniref:DUF983 domain-containing protein n=1 Tax=Asticcacaulis machinosus TaxID=2984211 RepID=A0ABT5HI38_9CAUL|nr:DUF983 domain-containing protein [Asticcacaulis machinosus]MDC7675867.1 DUF983 domain-containing protein [Asticcacaulis machinosus]